MAGSPISAMPPATKMANADVVPIVQAGVNLKCSKTILLTAAPGEEIVIVGPNNAHVRITPAGDLAIQCAPGHKITISANGGGFGLDATGNISLQEAPGKVILIGYSPLHPGDWAGVPTSVWEALDRIARVVSNNGATPIP